MESCGEPIFREKPASNLTEVEINTTISLFWRIEFKTCDCCGQGCFQQLITNEAGDIYQLFINGTGGEIPRVTTNNLLFCVRTILTPAEPGSKTYYANVRLIIFIDEYVQNSMPFILYCKAEYSNSNCTMNTYQSISSVKITVIDPMIPTTTTHTSTSKALVCNSVYSLKVFGFLYFTLLLCVVTSYFML